MILFKSLKRQKAEREASLKETEQLRIQAHNDLQKAIDLENLSKDLIKKIDEKLEVNHFAERYYKALGGNA